MQGWIAPAGAGGTVEAGFAPDGSYRAGLAAGGLALVALVALALLTSRSPRLRRVLRRSGPVVGRGPSPAATVPRWVGVPVVVAAGLALGGPVGVVLGALTAPVGLVGRGWLRAVLGAAVLALPLAAALVVALDPWPLGRANLDSAPVQALSLAGILLATALALLAPGARHRRARG